MLVSERRLDRRGALEKKEEEVVEGKVLRLFRRLSGRALKKSETPAFSSPICLPLLLFNTHGYVIANIS